MSLCNISLSAKKAYIYSIAIFFLSLVFALPTSAQDNKKIDSLKNIINNSEHDSVVINAYKAWDDIIYKSDPDLDLQLNLKIDSIASEALLNTENKTEKKFFLKALSFSNSNLGYIYNAIGDNNKALERQNKSLEVRKILKDKKAIAYTLNNIGSIYSEQGNHKKAIDYYTQSLATHEEANDKRGTAGALNNIAIIHRAQGNYDLALSFYKKSLEIKLALQDSSSIAISYLNIGTLYNEIKQYDKALDNYSKCLQISESIGDYKYAAIAYVNIGSIHHAKKELNEALKYYLLGFSIQKEKSTGKRIAETATYLGRVYLDMNNLPKSKYYGELAYELSFKNDVLKVSQDASNLLYKVYKKLGNNKKSLEMYEFYISTRDSIQSEENQKEVLRQKYKYDYEKQAAADSVKAAQAAQLKDAQLSAEQAENKRHQVEAQQQRQQKYLLYGGLSLALLFGVFIFNRFRVTRKQKGVIEEQKKKVDVAYQELGEKNKEILDSINYAQRIQSAIMPPIKMVKKVLPHSFILYKPKDIVAGDFYWMEQTEDLILIAAADCTGHGVPGAMVSVVCNNGLNRSVREHGLKEPAKILDKTREIVIAEFEKSEEEVKDGMDIALISLKKSAQSELEREHDASTPLSARTHTQNSHSLSYSGAHNPLWIIRKDTEEVEEIKADKQPIGKFGAEQPFTSHTVELQKGDTVYIFSDGFADQFGGEKGKKFKSKNFKKLLLSMQHKTMDNQYNLLNEAFEKWKGSIEQLDDVCVIGIQIS